jgi:Domain of unknown function (DUF4349)
MSHPTDTLDPAIARELEALEAALAGAPGADRDLAALVRDVRSEAPPVRPAFAAQLDERVREGFPRRQWWARLVPPRRALVPALGLAATALAAIVIAGSTGGDGARPALDSGGGSAAVQDATTPQQQRQSSVAAGATPAPASTGAAGESAAPAPAAKSLAPPAQSLGATRRVERDAQLTLTTAPGDVQDVADNVVSVTEAAGGIVSGSKVQTGDGGGSASFDLRIPSAKLDDTIKRLSDLAHVGSLSQGSADITASFNTAADRLSEVRAERRGLLRALARATTERQVQALRARLRANRSALSQAKGELQALRRRATLASVSVLVQGSGSSRGDTGGGAWTPRDALGDAQRVLEVAAGVALVAAAILVPLALLGAVAAAGGRATRRRRRAHALDGA